MLKIGWSKRDVSTDKPIAIIGQFYIRISKGIMDPIMLNCLVIDNEKDIVIFLSGDFGGGKNSINLIQKKMKSRYPEIPAEKIIFNVTHTHCSADLTLNPEYTFEPVEGIEIYPTNDYVEFFTNTAVDMIKEAYDNRKEGYIAYGYGYAVVSHSRRSTYFDDVSLRLGDKTKTSSLYVDGHAKMYGKTDDDNFMGFEGGADHFTNFLYTFDTDKKLTGAIINIPCPSQNSEMASYLTADYWNEVREILYSKYGDIGILPQCAAAGDLSPRTLHYLKAEERRYKLKYNQGKEKRASSTRKDQAEFICNSFDEVLSWAKKELISDAPLSHTIKTLKLKEIPLTKDQYDLATEQIEILKNEKPDLTDNPEENFKAMSIYRAKIVRFMNIINRYEKQKKNGLLDDTEIHVVKLGDIAFCTNPFELYIDYQHRIQARSPYTQTFIIQLTDQPKKHGGYLATERGMENLGYSANIYSNRISPEGGQVLVEETLTELKKLYNE